MIEDPNEAEGAVIEEAHAWRQRAHSTAASIMSSTAASSASQARNIAGANHAYRPSTIRNNAAAAGQRWSLAGVEEISPSSSSTTGGGGGASGLNSSSENHSPLSSSPHYLPHPHQQQHHLHHQQHLLPRHQHTSSKPPFHPAMGGGTGGGGVMPLPHHHHHHLNQQQHPSLFPSSLETGSHAIHDSNKEIIAGGDGDRLSSPFLHPGAPFHFQSLGAKCLLILFLRFALLYYF